MHARTLFECSYTCTDHTSAQMTSHNAEPTFQNSWILKVQSPGPGWYTLSMKQFIVHWHTVRDGYMIRGGYSVVHAEDKRGARKAIRGRDGVALDRGEKLRITKVDAV